ncbi:MAG TPA: four helix bundle protein [Terriglobales bacterium]|nr:four helix bundle protein [Terriglobales bacterium]
MEIGKPSTSRLASRRILDFTDLETWKFARTLRKELFLVVRGFPQEERYNLVSQIKRAASSVTANLAEGFGRYSYQENIQFCRQSRGSLYELRDHLTAALDAGYISEEKYRALDAIAISATRLVNGYIRATKNLKNSSSMTKRPL